MSIRSHLIELAELTLHWRGQTLLLNDVKGLIGCQEQGRVEFFPQAQINDISPEWTLILEFERAHGWLSIRHAKGPSVMCLNGRSLTKSPLLIKEASLMMPPHSNQSIELFLSESLENWSSARTLDESEMQQRLTHQSAQFATQEAMKTHELMNFSAQCQSEYGILRQNGELVSIESEYLFGALKFEITDGECWVSSEDGVLQINGAPCSMAQIYVGDQMQWQNNIWVVVGLSSLKRTQPVQNPHVFDAEIEEDLPEINEVSSKVSLKGHHGLFSLTQYVDSEQKRQSVSDEELSLFREKISSWLDYEPDLKPLQDAELTAALKNQLKQGATTPNETQLALLKIGRRSHSWREVNESEEDFAKLMAKIPHEGPDRRMTPYWHNVVIVSASICGGALLATLVGLLFVM